jgi:hypothetical protein
MTYYRLAVQDRQSTHWIWKTTAVTSLQAVLQLLRIYRMLPQDGIRVFTASSEAELNEMLRRQNNYLASGSVTAAQFLQARMIAGGEQAQSKSEERVSPQTVQQGTNSVAWATWEKYMVAQQGAETATWARELWETHQAAQATQHEHLATTGAPSSLGMSFQEKKRLEIELGSGDDHDTPYLFTLPISQKERLAWIRLQQQVQAGKLLS